MPTPVVLHEFSSEVQLSLDRINHNFGALVAAINALAGEEVTTLGTPISGDPEYLPISGGRVNGQISAPSIVVGPTAGPLYKVVTTNDAANEVVKGVVNRLSDVIDLSQTITDPPTQLEVQNITDKIDELLAALRAAGVMTTP